jgi:tRNA-intron endonuclease
MVGGGYVVFDEDDAAELYWNGFFGRPVRVAKPKKGDILSPLRLTHHEVRYLSERNKLEIFKGKKRIKIPDFKGRARTVYSVYRHLRDNGFVVRSGLKFGATFAAYVEGPGIDHAPLLIQTVDINQALTGIEVIRAGRLSHGIKKNFVFSSLDAQGKPIYATLSWVRS